MPGTKILEQIKLQLKHNNTDDLLDIYIDVFDNSLSQKWLTALNQLIAGQYHLEKNYCFLGFADGPRNIEYLCTAINQSIQAINQSSLDYVIDDYFSPENTINSGEVGSGKPGLTIIHDKFNHLHRYFEDLQGTSANISSYYNRANAETRWHIRQLNLLCHEAESWILSNRKKYQAPEWQRPSMLMCWLNAPRFKLEQEDFEYFGVDTLCRPTGGVFLGVNKAVGKHHWEVFQDEGRESRLDELVTTSLNSQTEAAGDFDIEWGQDTRQRDFMVDQLNDFRSWLKDNGFDPNDSSLTIGHPQVAQVDLTRSFGTDNLDFIWKQLSNHLDVHSISTSTATDTYPYRWSDDNYTKQQIEIIRGTKND